MRNGLFVVWRPDDFAFLDFNIKWNGRLGMYARKKAKYINTHGKKVLSIYDNRTKGARFLKKAKDIAWEAYPKPQKMAP